MSGAELVLSVSHQVWHLADMICHFVIYFGYSMLMLYIKEAHSSRSFVDGLYFQVKPWFVLMFQAWIDIKFKS